MITKVYSVDINLPAGACGSLVMPGANTCLHAPLPNLSIEECKKYSHSNITFPDLRHVQKDSATSEKKKRKKLPVSRITLRNNCKGLERCKIYVQGHRVLHGTFSQTKVKCGTFPKVRWRSTQKYKARF